MYLLVTLRAPVSKKNMFVTKDETAPLILAQMISDGFTAVKLKFYLYLTWAYFDLRVIVQDADQLIGSLIKGQNGADTA